MKDLKVFILIIVGFLCSVYINRLVQLKQYSDWKENFDDNFIENYNAEDERLINHIRKYYLEPPSDRNVPYDLNNPNIKDWSQNGQSKIVEKYFAKKTNGFFIECGAYDGETWSNTLSFEIYYNWTGLLIEADYANLKILSQKRRKSWILKGCLNGGDKVQKVTLAGGGFIGGLLEHTTFIKRLLIQIYQPLFYQDVWCFPLLSVLLALNRTNVDYFSLDVEGAEMDILQGIPFDKISVDLLQVEFIINHGLFVDKKKSEERKQLIRDFVRNTLPDHTELTVVESDIFFAKSKKLT